MSRRLLRRPSVVRDVLRELQSKAAVARLQLMHFEVRAALPVDDFRDELLATISDNPVVVCVGETGSGKPTQVRTWWWVLGPGSGENTHVCV